MLVVRDNERQDNKPPRWFPDLADSEEDVAARVDLPGLVYGGQLPPQLMGRSPV